MSSRSGRASGGGRLPPPPFVLFDDNRAPSGGCRLFWDVAETVSCDRPEGVPAALRRIAEAGRAGLHAAGFLAYELGFVLEPRLLPLLPADRSLPLIRMGLYRRQAELTSAEVTDMLPDPAGVPEGLAPLRPRVERRRYLEALARVHEYILAGDVYQINLTFPLEFRFDGDPVALYGLLRRRQRAGYGALAAGAEGWVLSLSPELFVEVAGGLARTRPMKGTAARVPRPGADADRRQALREDEKSRAENLMIVDLLRNDLSKVAVLGSVTVTDLFTVETYPTLHQMTSGITARLRAGVGFAEVVGALFPCGSVTGAPKVRAMEIIRELEDGPRGIYTGAIGFVAADGEMRFNVAIRTLEIGPDGAGRMGVGAGIVYDSRPEAEYDECLLKARFLGDSLEPFDLVETLRLEDGAYFLLDRHLERLAASAAWFGLPCGREEAAAELERTARACGPGLHRVRLLLGQDGGLEITAAPLPLPDPDAVWTYVLSPRAVDRNSPFTWHKTTRRDLYDQERARLCLPGGPDEVLFLNEAGELAEGSISTVFLLRQGTLLTPPLDHGLLPGTLRAELLAVGRAREAVLMPSDLETADAVFLGNSVRGLIRAIALGRNVTKS